MIALCFAAALIEGFDLQAAGVAAPTLVPELGLTPGQVGLFFSAATFGLLFGALAGGRFSDLYGRKSGLMLSLALFGLFSVLTAFAGSFEALFAARFLTGLGLGGALPNLVAIAAEASRPERRGSAVAAMYAGMPVGGALAALTALAALEGGWRTVFITGGVAPLLLVPVVWWLMPGGGAPSPEGGAAAPLKALFGPGNAASTLLLWMSFLLALLVLYLLLNWLPTLLIGGGLSKADAGIVQIGFNLTGAAASLVLGAMMDRGLSRLAVLGAFGGLAAALLLLAVTPGTLGWALLAGAMAGGAAIGVQSILYGIAPSLYPAPVRGTGVGAAVAAGRTGSVIGPLLAGLLLAAGRAPVEVLAALLPIALAGGAAAFVLVVQLRPGSAVQPSSS